MPIERHAINEPADKNVRAQVAGRVSSDGRGEPVGGERMGAVGADKNARAPIRTRGEPWRWDKTDRRPLRRRAYELVARKGAAEGPLEPGEAWVEQNVGSKGWNSRGYLPHFDKPGTMQMLTFRLGDAMPAARRSEWELLARIEDQRERRTKLEAYLDRGYGECVLKRPEAAKAMEDVLLRFDGERYRLLAWVVMPNHVHVLVELWTIPLGALCKAWKGASANAINRCLGRSGELWQADYWDRRIRDEDHFRKALHYVESNPVKAGLTQTAAEWAYGSANAKWQWVGASRYHGGHLARLNRKRGETGPPTWVAMPIEADNL
jgi:putative transposase